MKKKIISKDDIDKMVDEIKVENKKKKKVKKYINENKEEVIEKIKKIDKEFTAKFKIMKFLVLIDIIFLVFFISPNNFLLQFFNIISMFYAFSIFFQIRSKKIVGIMGNYLIYLFFLTTTFTINIFNQWTLFNNFYGYIFIALFLYCHLIFFGKKFYLNKLLIISYLLLIIVIYLTYFSTMYIDVNDSIQRNDTINESIKICQQYEDYSLFCDYTILKLNNNLIIDDCLSFQDNSSKSICVNYFKKRDKLDCDLLNESLKDYCK